jgi:hypothetical protein
MRAIHLRRLLNVVRALEESPNPERFTMAQFGHECGTPACALGHYCARTDLQSAFVLSKHTDRGDREMPTWPAPIDDVTVALGFDDEEVRTHFGLTEDQAEELFGSEGCDGARTALEAAAYIRAFVARRERDLEAK